MSRLLKDQHVHVVGLGLMGASLALALRGKAARITGEDIQQQVASRALNDGAIDAITESDKADFVIVAIPADHIGGALMNLKLKPGAIVMDLGSTKGQICAQMDTLPAEIQAVGGHPMCGVAENGYANAFPTLYAGARFILCETARTGEESRELCEQLLAAIGASPLWMDRNHHDYMAGAISHLPHLMSFALMRLAMHLNENGSSVYELAAGGFDGATRLARTDEAMITGMFRTNAPILRELVGQLQRHLDDLTALLDDPDKLRQELDMIVEERRKYTHDYGERLIT
jgi:prephenate dehydrogenase